MILPTHEDAGPRSLRILLVDDHVDGAVAMAKYLSLMGHVVVVAGSVEEALQKADPLPDLLITDLVFPDGTGFDVLRRLGGSNRVVALALSGLASKQDQQQSLEAGFREHLVKPLELPLLLAAINRVAVFMKYGENED